MRTHALSRLGDGIHARSTWRARASSRCRRSSSTLGPYDYWAIEYAYKPLDPATEPAELAKIAAAQRRAASSPTAPTRTTSSASIPMRCSSTWAATSARSRRSASRSRATCSSARRRARSRRARTTRCCAARSATRSATWPAPSACWRARSVACARLRDFPGSGRDPLQPVRAGAAARGARRDRARPARRRQLRRLAGAAAPPRARLRGARRGRCSAARQRRDRLLARRSASSRCSAPRSAS